MKALGQDLRTYTIYLCRFKHCRWISLGNQLSGVRLVDEGLRARYKAAFPDQVIHPPDPPSRAGGQESKPSVQENDSSPSQTKSSPVARIEVLTTTITVSSTVVTGVDEKLVLQDSEMLLN